MTVDALMKSKSLEHPILNPKKKEGTPPPPTGAVNMYRRSI